MLLIIPPPVFSSESDHTPLSETNVSGFEEQSCFNSEVPLIKNNPKVIQLKKAGRLYLIEAIIDGKTGYLVFDTGASALVLNMNYFNHPLMHTRKSNGGSVTGSLKPFKMVVSCLSISDLNFKNISADIIDLSHLELHLDIEILGLFGLNLLREFEVIFDTQNNNLQFYPIDKKGNCILNITSGYEFDHTHRMEVRNNIATINASIGEIELRFCLDTGAEINLINHALPNKVLQKISISQQSEIMGTCPGSVNASYGKMKEFTIGDFDYEDMDVAIIDLTHISNSYGYRIVGILGFDFWQKGVYKFNCKKQLISLSTF